MAQKPSEFLDQLRRRANMSMDELARGMGYRGQSGIQRYLSPDYEQGFRPELIRRIVSAFEKANMPLSEEEIAVLGFTRSRSFPELIAPPLSKPNAQRLTTPVDFGSRRTIPVYGQAIGGSNGRFEFNGQRIAEVLAPPMLQNVPDAYAVMIVGESMVPRYFAGETAYVHPRMPVRRDDFVVVQITPETDGDAPAGYVKQFKSWSAERLRLTQFNPPEGEDQELEFPSEDVVSVHKIVLSGAMG